MLRQPSRSLILAERIAFSSVFAGVTLRAAYAISAKNESKNEAKLVEESPLMIGNVKIEAPKEWFVPRGPRKSSGPIFTESTYVKHRREYNRQLKVMRLQFRDEIRDIMAEQERDRRERMASNSLRLTRIGKRNKLGKSRDEESEILREQEVIQKKIERKKKKFENYEQMETKRVDAKLQTLAELYNRSKHYIPEEEFDSVITRAVNSMQKVDHPEIGLPGTNMSLVDARLPIITREHVKTARMLQKLTSSDGENELVARRQREAEKSESMRRTVPRRANLPTEKDLVDLSQIKELDSASIVPGPAVSIVAAEDWRKQDQFAHVSDEEIFHSALLSSNISLSLSGEDKVERDSSGKLVAYSVDPLQKVLKTTLPLQQKQLPKKLLSPEKNKIANREDFWKMLQSVSENESDVGKIMDEVAKKGAKLSDSSSGLLLCLEAAVNSLKLREEIYPQLRIKMNEQNLACENIRHKVTELTDSIRNAQFEFDQLFEKYEKSHFSTGSRIEILEALKQGISKETASAENIATPVQQFVASIPSQDLQKLHSHLETLASLHGSKQSAIAEFVEMRKRMESTYLSMVTYAKLFESINLLSAAIQFNLSEKNAIASHIISTIGEDASKDVNSLPTYIDQYQSAFRKDTQAQVVALQLISSTVKADNVPFLNRENGSTLLSQADSLEHFLALPDSLEDYLLDPSSIKDSIIPATETPTTDSEAKDLLSKPFTPVSLYHISSELGIPHLFKPLELILQIKNEDK